MGTILSPPRPPPATHTHARPFSLPTQAPCAPPLPPPRLGHLDHDVVECVHRVGEDSLEGQTLDVNARRQAGQQLVHRGGDSLFGEGVGGGAGECEDGQRRGAWVGARRAAHAAAGGGCCWAAACRRSIPAPLAAWRRAYRARRALPNTQPHPPDRPPTVRSASSIAASIWRRTAPWNTYSSAFWGVWIGEGRVSGAGWTPQHPKTRCGHPSAPAAACRRLPPYGSCAPHAWRPHDSRAFVPSSLPPSLLPTAARAPT